VPRPAYRKRQWSLFRLCDNGPDTASLDQSRGLKASCRGFNIIGGAKFVCKLINGNRPRIAERHHRLEGAELARDSITSGRAAAKLDALVRETNLSR
jgi:hypothetical protein